MATQRGSHSLPNINESRTPSMDPTETFCRLSASYQRSKDEDDDDDKLKHFKLPPFVSNNNWNVRWIHGYNQKVRVINMNNKGSTVVFYAAANCGVLYNWTKKQMKILQGHKHVVTSIVADKNCDWLVTSDSGPENIIIIWNSADLYPQKTLFSPHGSNKTSNVAMSADAKYLLTLAYIPEGVMLHWWIWSFGWDSPHAKLQIELNRGSVLDVGFNPSLSDQFLLLTKNNIWLGISRKVIIIERGMPKETDMYELKISSPGKVVKPDYGRLTCYTFVEKTGQILAGSTRGSIYMYGYSIEYSEGGSPEAADYEQLRFIKVLKLEKKKINVIKSIDNMIVTGNNTGEMHFYDEQLKLMFWLHDLPVDCIKGLSFNISPRSVKIFGSKCKKICLCWEKVKVGVDPETGVEMQKMHLEKIPTDATTSGKPFLIRDFLLTTVTKGVGFVDFVTEKIETVIDNRPSPILTITVHPDCPLLCLGYSDGVVELYNFIQNRAICRLDFREKFTIVIPPEEESINFDIEKIVPVLAVTCVQYAPSGLHLACGLNTGEIVFLDPTTIDLLTPKPFQDTKYAIKQITYSMDSLTMAFADAGKTVGVYKYNCSTFTWTFLGKHRAHYKDITVLLFLPLKTDGNFQLLSIGKDRIMVEYDLSSSSDDYLEISSLDRIDQTAVPLTGILWPSPPELDPELQKTDLPLILVANDEYKYKILNYSTTMTLATVLGPRFEHPVHKLQLINKTEGNEVLQYLLFATKDVMGLQKLPLDGNPYKHAGMLGHPVRILDMAFREDRGTLFTIGEKDTAMIQWAANYRSVEVSTKNGGGDLDPYYCLIENQRPGWLFQEIRDLFYYVQILCQGTFSPAMRRVKDYIPIDSLPDLMRALGFFPSEYEVENLIVEAKYQVYLRNPATEINFEDFVKLYLNHRPVFGVSYKRIRAAFRYLAEFRNEDYTMTREDFVEMLTTNGERFSRELAWYLLSVLSGHSLEDRAAMNEEDFSFLPEVISFSELVNEIIGVQELDNVSETFSSMESVGSMQSSHDSNSDDDL